MGRQSTITKPKNKDIKKIKKEKKNIFKTDVKEIKVGRRMASLNASAMMHASYGREEKVVRRDPLTIAIEASLRDAKEKEIKEMLDRVEIEENLNSINKDKCL